MAKITLPPEIIGISGRVGNMIFRTTKDGRTFVSSANRKQRSTQPKRFMLMAQEVARRIANGDHRQRAIIWREVKQTFG